MTIPREPAAVVRERAIRRVRLLGGVFAVCLAAICARGVQLCVAPSELTARIGAGLRWGPVVLEPERGDVYDRHGARLATSVPTPTVAVDPLLVDAADVEHLADALAGILHLDRDEVATAMRRDRRYVVLAKDVHPAQADAVRALGERALILDRMPKRFYPEQTLAAQVIGFVNGGDRGQEGLEKALDPELRGAAVLMQRRRDRRGRSVDGPTRTDANQGFAVHTTIDRSVQRLAERALANVVERSDPVSATAIVVEVKTGDIVAMANVPTFNPNDLETDAAPRKNHAILDAIEPGSVMKPFSLAAAIEVGLVGPDTRVDCEGGAWNIGRARIRDDHPHGVVTVTEVLKYSSNIGTAKLALQLGPDRFLEQLRAFGFSRPTGILLPGERDGFLRRPDKIKPIELATTAYGQGATATPLQVVMAMAALANDGVLMKPRLVTLVEDEYGVPEAVYHPTAAGRAVSVETARAVSRMLATVTEDGGTGTRARVEGFSVAGKTGTAEKVKDGRYSDARIGSFVGFVPAEAPVIAVIVTVDEPRKGSRYGGTVAGPAFAEIAAGTLRHLGVEPTVVKAQEAVAEAAVVEPEPVELAWAGDAWRLPDLRGRTLRDVLNAVDGAGLRVALRGSGAAIDQDPPAGALVPLGSTLTVVFQ